MKVHIYQSGWNENFYNVSYQDRKGNTEAIETEMTSRLGAIGYAICFLENVVREMRDSDNPTRYSSFSIDQLSDVIWRLHGLHTDILYDSSDYLKA